MESPVASASARKLAATGFHFARAFEHTTLEFEMLKAISRLRCLGQPDDRITGYRFFMTQAEKIVLVVAGVRVWQISL